MIRIDKRVSLFIIASLAGVYTISYSTDAINFTEDRDASNIPAGYKIDEYYREGWEREKPKIIAKINKDNRAIDRPEYHHDEDATKDWGYTPICSAAEGDDFKFVTYLLENGADPSKEIKSVHSSRPIFFAKSLEMVQFLQDNGADIHESNTGTGFKRGMNFLHAAIQCNTDDDRLPGYALTQGFDPNSLNSFGGNLWHSLMYISASYCPEERLMSRARLLHELGIDPHHKDNFGESAIDMVKRHVAEETKFLNKCEKESDFYDFEHRIAARDKLQRVVDFMEKGDSVKEEVQE